MLSLQGEMEQAGGMLALSSPFVEAEIAADGFVVRSGGGAPLEFSCATVVNTSGLDAPDNARAIRGMPRDLIPEQGLAKGNYFSCARKVPFSRLIYPVPEPGGLGVHLTIDMVGQGRFGPDVEWVTIRDFQVDESRKAAMLSSIRKYWPAIGEDDLVPAYAGIRPKLMDPAADFMIQGPRDHGIAGLVNLFGIESPGLTSSLAIACAVLDTLDPS
jgi:L-2-hydroxyglutarate oxidase LhgO